MPESLRFYHNIYSFNPSFSKFVQINCPDISEFQFQFQDKNNLFACLFAESQYPDWDQDYTFSLNIKTKTAFL